MIIAVIMSIAIFFCIATVVISIGYIIKMYNSIDTVLDRILAKDEHLRSEVTGENRISKLIHKANRIMDMYITEAVQSTEEKENIQGFISDMSHQMKTPLAGIAMYTDLLMEGDTTPNEQQEFLTRIKLGTDSLKWLMENLIKMSKLEVGAIQLSPVYQHIKQTISDAIGNVYTAASKKNIAIEVKTFDDIPLYHDKRWTKEAITNILENAVKYSHADNKIEITIEPMPMHTKIIITDFGIGINKNDWHLIFKRFYRGLGASTVEGAGLGLYLATIIMEKQGGYIMVDSVPQKFTSFSLYFQNNEG